MGSESHEPPRGEARVELADQAAIEEVEEQHCAPGAGRESVGFEVPNLEAHGEASCQGGGSGAGDRHLRGVHADDVCGRWINQGGEPQGVLAQATGGVEGRAGECPREGGREPAQPGVRGRQRGARVAVVPAQGSLLRFGAVVE